MRAKRLAVAVLVVGLISTIAQADPIIVVKDDMTLPQTIITSEGTYIVIPDYTTGAVQSVVKVADTKKKE
jgi:hypothetical protein